MDLQFVIAYIKGDADEITASRVRDWISESDENRKEFYRLKNIYALTRGLSDIPEKKEDYEKVKNRLWNNSHTRTVRLLKHTLRYAAVAAITLLAVIIYQTLPVKEHTVDQTTYYHQIHVPLGQISEFTFADGTRAWLNSGTSLRFPATPEKDTRKIYLEGEAYFEVSKDETRTFIVCSGPQEVRVFGTSFNVRAYEENGFIETTLVEGSLGIIPANQEDMLMLKPGEQFRLSMEGEKNILHKVDTHPYQAWKDGKLIFRNKTLCNIAFDLERWYNVKISFDDEKIKDLRFSGTILKYKPIDQILEAIKLTSPIRYTIQVHPERSSEIVLYAGK
jgi:transmembrane sensor